MPQINLDWKGLEELKSQVRVYSNDKPDIIVDSENYTLTLPVTEHSFREKVYIPNGSLVDFHKDQDAKVKLEVGPFRSGKSTSCCAEIVFHTTLKMPRMYDGVRRARWAIIRGTMGQLETTTLKTWLNWFQHLGETRRTKKPVYTYTHYFNDGNGPIELEIIFLALDREEDRQKLESLELTGGYINEMQHIHQGIFIHLQGRINMFPPKDDLMEEYEGIVIADSNPPDEDHWIYKTFEENDNPLLRVFHQPPGLLKDDSGSWHSNDERDNKTHIPENYYLNLAQGSNWDLEFIKVFCCGEYGIVSHGKVVFHEYNDNIHAVDEVMVLDNKEVKEVYVFWDYGVTPCALICQFSHQGQFRAVKEFVSERSGVKQLAKIFVKPYIAQNFPDFNITSIGDPANPTAQTDLNTCQNVLAEEGFPTRPAKTNNIEARLNAGRDFLNRLIDGVPAFVLSKKGCPSLRKALKKEYCYRRIRVIGEEKYEEKPNKTHPWSDIADCFEYGCLEFTFLTKNDIQNDFDYKKFHQYVRY